MGFTVFFCVVLCCVFEFFVQGVPVPQGSKSGRVVEGRVVLTDGFGDKPRRLGVWRDAVFGGAPDLRLDGPVWVELVFFLPRPASVSRVVPFVRPDLDKLVRAVLDGLTCRGGVGLLCDDSRVVRLVAEKRYADGCDAGVLVRGGLWMS